MGFGVVIGGSCDQGSDEGAEQSLSPSSGVVDELEKSEIGGQLLLRDTAMRTEPGAHPGPEALNGIDVDFAEAIAVLIPRILTPTLADRLVPVAPGRQAGIDGVFVGMDERARRDGRRDDRLDRCLPDIVEHLQNDVTAALDQAEDRRSFFLQRAPTGSSFEPAAPSRTAFLATVAGLPLCPATI